MFSTLVWLLFSFIWSGERLHELDRPFADLFDKDFGDKEFKRRDGGEKEDLQLEEKIFVEPVEATFVNVWNRVLCPQCIARLAVINGVIVSL